AVFWAASPAATTEQSANANTIDRRPITNLLRSRGVNVTPIPPARQCSGQSGARRYNRHQIHWKERTMARGVSRFVRASLSSVIGIVSVTAILSGQAPVQPSTRNGEWPTYNADVKGTRYSPLDQIDATNFS